MNQFFKKASVNSKDLFVYFLLFSMLVLFTRPAINGGDIRFWLSWSSYIFEHGLSNAYQNGDNNYNPLFHYFLFIYNLLAGSQENIIHYLSFLKVFPLLFDFIGALVAVSLVKEKDRRFFLSLLLLFNAGYLYNSLIWVQVDAIFTGLVFIAVALALKRQAVWSMLFYVLALNAKTQAIIFLPFLIMLWSPIWLKSLRSMGVSIVAAGVLQVLILIPFMWFGNQNDLNRIIDINFNAVDFYPLVSLNAYNIWCFLIEGKQLTEVSDALVYGGLTYKQWGLLLFCLFSGVVLLPLFVLTVRNLITSQTFSRFDYALVMLSGALIPVCFCFFNTQMHERYWHPAILFLAAYAFLTRKFGIYIIASVAYFLNMEGVMRYLNMKKYTILIFHPQFVACLFSIVLLLGIWRIYQLSDLKQNLSVITAGVKRRKLKQV